jgi:hypothetical protein
MLFLSLRIPVQALVRTRISYCFNNIYASVKFYYDLLHFLMFLNIQMWNIEIPSDAAYTVYVYLWLSCVENIRNTEYFWTPCSNCDALSHTTGCDISLLSQNPDLYHCLHNKEPLLTILIQINPVLTLWASVLWDPLNHFLPFAKFSNQVFFPWSVLNR